MTNQFSLGDVALIKKTTATNQRGLVTITHTGDHPIVRVRVHNTGAELSYLAAELVEQVPACGSLRWGDLVRIIQEGSRSGEVGVVTPDNDLPYKYGGPAPRYSPVRVGTSKVAIEPSALSVVSQAKPIEPDPLPPQLVSATSKPLFKVGDKVWIYTALGNERSATIVGEERENGVTHAYLTVLDMNDSSERPRVERTPVTKVCHIDS